MFYEDELKCLVVSKTGAVPDLKARAVSRTFPGGQKNFEFDFPYKQVSTFVETVHWACFSWSDNFFIQGGY